MSTNEEIDLPQKNLSVPPNCAYANHDSTTKQAKSKIIKATDENISMDFDDILPYVGQFGCYQKKLFALMIPFTIFLPWVYFSQIFITLIPEGYWCMIPELVNLTIEQRYKMVNNFDLKILTMFNLKC